MGMVERILVRCRRLVCVVSILLFAVPVQAQLLDTSVTVNFYGLDNGLANPDVNEIFRDSFGMLWIGTNGGGVSCFDAMHFFNYYPNPRHPDSLVDGNIRGISEDQEHNIWLATAKGLSCYDRTLMHFRNYAQTYETTDSTEYSGVLGVYVTRENTYWMLTYRGLARFNPNTGSATFYDFPYLLKPSSRFPQTKIREDRDGLLWVLISGILLSFDPEQERYATLRASGYETGGSDLEHICGFAFDREHHLCLATEENVYVYRDAINLPLIYPTPRQECGKRLQLESFWLDHYDDFWGLSDGRLYFLEKTTGAWQRYRNIYTPTEKLGFVPNAGVNFDDKHLFFFPIEGGFAMWDLRPTFFTQTTSRLDCQSQLRNKSVTAIYTREDKGVWIGTSDGEVLYFDRSTDTVVNFTDLQSSPLRQHSSRVNAFYRFSSGELIAGTSEGLLYFDPKEEEWGRNFSSSWLYSLAEKLDGKYINKLTPLDTRRLGIGLRDGFFVYDLQKHLLQEYPSLRGKDIREFTYEDSDHVVCVGDHSLYRVNLEVHSCEGIDFATAPDGKLLEVSALSVAHGTDKSLWVGTNDGLFHLEHGESACYLALSHYFFKSNPLNALACDQHGNVWIATQRGIVEYDPMLSQLFLFGKNDGLRYKSFSRNISFVSPQNEIYFGGTIGLTYFRPRAHERTENDRVLVSKLTFFCIGEVREIPTLTTHSLTLPENSPSVSFQLTLLDFANRSPVYFQVMLEGHYDRWTDVESLSIVNINNLREGDYVFRYRASLDREVWTEGEPYHLHVLRDFSLRDFIWNYLPFITILFIVLTIFFVRYYIMDSHSKVNERIKMTMHLEALNQSLQEKDRVIDVELHNARHSQNVILPSLQSIQRSSPSSFILFEPLREVSGDIYWYSTYEQYIYVGVIDCTGHGISAAIMSLITYVFLHDIIIVRHVTSASRILTLLSNSLYERNMHLQNMEVISEGADVSMCVIDTERQMINFAGAFLRMIHCHNGIADVYTGDAAFVGSEGNLNFTSRMIHYKPSDELFLFSDGYSDQIGGPHAKKMRFARFQELIAQASQLPIAEQEGFLAAALAEWQGANSQYDDITVLGLKCDFQTGRTS